MPCGSMGNGEQACSAAHQPAAPSSALSPLPPGPIPPPPRWQPGDPYTVILFYRYAQLEPAAVDSMVNLLRDTCSALGLAGRVLLAVEGVNGTLAGSEAAVQAFISFFSALHPAFSTIDWKRSQGAAAQLPFPDTTIRHVREIINTGPAKQVLAPFVSFDPSTFGGLAPESTGTHVTPQEFHAMLNSATPCGSSSQGDPSAQPPPAEPPLVLDIRNNYEYDVGHFEGAVGLDVATYADSWKLLDDIIEEHQLLGSSRPVLMYCTGGIRCEKASAYVRAAGLERGRVFQLQGGIHRYLEEFPDGGHFKGKNVVFDARCAMAAPAHEAATEGTALLPEGERCSREQGALDRAVLTCSYCSGTEDAVLGRCAVCNAVLQVCGACHARHCGAGEFHCRRHVHLSGLYFKNLERYDPGQLEQQAGGLAALLAATDGQENKNKRRTLRNQIQRIQRHLAERGGVGPGADAAAA